MKKTQSKHSQEEIESFFIHQRDIFLHFSGYNKKVHSNNLTEQERITLRLLQVFQLADLAGFMDLLSINLRPNNYELGSESLNTLKNWVDSLDHQPTMPSKKKWLWW